MIFVLADCVTVQLSLFGVVLVLLLGFTAMNIYTQSGLIIRLIRRPLRIFELLSLQITAKTEGDSVT